MRPKREHHRSTAAWRCTLAIAFTLAACAVCVGGEDFANLSEEPAAIGTSDEQPRRAKLIPIDVFDVETGEEGDFPWDDRGIVRIGATQIAPLLVPLPDHELPPPIAPSPLPPPPEPSGGENVGPLGIEPLVPFSKPGCPGCSSGLATTPDGGKSALGYTLQSREDEFGIGSRQVPFAIFHIDPVAPLSQLRLRADFANGLTMPDRVERFWAASPLGPSQPERKVDFRTFSVYSEMGGDQFSAFTEIPLVSMSSELNGDTTGLGNIVLGQKFLLTNPKNRRWQIAQILRTYLPTGSTRRGLGNGLTALEPGLLFRYRATNETYLHGEVKYWIPLGGDPEFSGQVVQYGGGVSTVLWQTDNRAILTSLEVIGSTIGDGQATLPSGVIVPAGGTTFASILPGLRMTLGPSGDLGLFEIGVSGGVTFGDPGWYDSRVLLDLRWSF